MRNFLRPSIGKIQAHPFGNRIGRYLDTCRRLVGFQSWKQPNSAPELSPVTTFSGHERNPSFNPDGTQIAFSWDGGVHEGNENIYVKVVGPDEPVRLTNNKAREFGTAWSPDGRFVAFLRFTGFGRAEIIAVPALGGSERKLGETASINTPGFFPGHQLAWTPDGKWLCFADRGSSDQVDGLFLMSVATGEKHRMTTAPNTARDRGPSFSPDGRWLAFCRVRSLGVNDIYLLRLTPAYQPGEIRQLTLYEGTQATLVGCRTATKYYSHPALTNPIARYFG